VTAYKSVPVLFPSLGELGIRGEQFSPTGFGVFTEKADPNQELGKLRWRH